MSHPQSFIRFKIANSVDDASIKSPMQLHEMDLNKISQSSVKSFRLETLYSF